MKLLIDMNLFPRWTGFFERQGIPAEHWSQVGLPTASDKKIMNHAEHHGFIVLTHDLDFGAILASAQGRGPSVVQLRADDSSPEANGALEIDSLQRCRTELIDGALLTIDAARVRLTLLPLIR